MTFAKDCQDLARVVQNHPKGNSVAGSSKGEFKRLGRKVLKQFADQLGLEKGTYEVAWNEGGTGVSGECMLLTGYLYVQISDTDLGIMYRPAAKDDKYGARGHNHWAPWHAVSANPEEVFRRIQNLHNASKQESQQEIAHA